MSRIPTFSGLAKFELWLLLPFSCPGGQDGADLSKNKDAKDATATPASVVCEKLASSIFMASPFSPIVLGGNGESVLPKNAGTGTGTGIGVGANAHANIGTLEGEKKDKLQSS
ncbi:hypothetical protein GYMLUDRAFT_263621 [Collybiopsis luxurians FD-317 M1]|uniref:Uncharacterized protein n=1 Tax=Collybiopsis luxurians FD-317 M1 TaxID=944289 RepID=A0A0D0CMS9_9AGAR|nr:hypothetical protein GYMLUDRAFT_263621 [Collybiopsis luxurians FD-317 M1]